MARSHDDVLGQLLRLRIAVAYLGEKEQFAWWSTRFMGSAGKRFLEFNYPRSAFSAGVTAASEAAKAFHDRRIGKGRASHLFRLPLVMEQRMRALLLETDGSPYAPVVANKDAATLALSELAKDSVSEREGPVRVGDDTMLSSGTAIPKLAAFYAAAFKAGKHTLPYFTADEG